MLKRIDLSRLGSFESAEALPWSKEEPYSSTHFDLLLNPEQFTGYKGESASRVWRYIYDHAFRSKDKPSDLDYDHVEARLFNRLVSGLHSSISVHLCKHHYLAGDKWGLDLDEFTRRLSPERLGNLYFLYVVLLQAVDQFYNTVMNYPFEEFHHNSEQIRPLLEKLYENRNDWPVLEDVELMFEADHQQIEEFRLHFYQLSLAMDCVACFRCKLWGKLQVMTMESFP